MFTQTQTEITPLDILQRPRRNRRTAAIRSLTQETRLHPSQMIYPYFVIEGHQQSQAIESLPGVSRLSLDLLLSDAIEAYNLGIRAINLFPLVPSDRKDRYGRESLRQGNLVHQAISLIKNEIPEMCVWV
jgi:porphobilinogen synthase